MRGYNLGPSLVVKAHMPWQAQTYSIYENFSFLFFFWEGGGGLSSTDRSIRVCLVGVKTRMMKNRERKNRVENAVFHCLVGKGK